ncbi:hypothetical protein IU450_36240 [Nocardia abscessus]|uniref:hypothetical protein n=1 Tax=Nocardia abscessus TaxID=120957 RepID=UPI001893C8C9|nr:hypothetical protein [Nocardia abscessus]MBF6341293.1 hypothetical protein [Nocardia abscessus]
MTLTTFLFAALASAALIYFLGGLAIARGLRRATSVTRRQRRAAAVGWPLLLARTISRRSRYVRVTRACTKVANHIGEVCGIAGYDFAPDARDLLDALHTAARLPRFSVFLRDTAAQAPLEQPAEPALTEIRTALARAIAYQKHDM